MQSDFEPTDDAPVSVENGISDAAWTALIDATNGNFLQSAAWGAAKDRWGWTPRRVGLQSGGELVAGAQLLFRRLPLGFSIAYVPRGPLLRAENAETFERLLDAVHAECRRRRAVLLTIEPDLRLPNSAATRAAILPAVSANLERLGFRPAPATIQPSATMIIDLRQSEEEILAAMHQKWRYNIRLAARKEVAVRQGTLDDIPTFHALTLLTGERDEFAVRPAGYYADVFRAFGEQAHLFVAEYQGRALGAIMVVRSGDTATYLYGASSNEERQRMPNHALQWAAIQQAQADGCRWYDFWGIPPEVPESGEVEEMGQGGLWGVFRFKQGFGGTVVKYPGAFDYVYNRPGYWLYSYIRRRRAEH